MAGSLLEQFADGVFFVSLAPISDPGLVGSTVAGVLGIKESGGQPLEETLHDYLRTKQVLLVLDNFEHLLAAAYLVVHLLAAAPRLNLQPISRLIAAFSWS